VVRDEAYIWLFVKDPLTAFQSVLDRKDTSAGAA
jgi:hypothetical protein